MLLNMLNIHLKHAFSSWLKIILGSPEIILSNHLAFKLQFRLSGVSLGVNGEVGGTGQGACLLPFPDGPHSTPRLLGHLQKPRAALASSLQ